MSVEPSNVTPLPTAQTLRLWSVTSIERMARGLSEPLVRWRVNQAAEAAVKRYGLLGKMIADEGPEEAAKWLAGRADARSRKAKVRGTDVHAAAEALNKGLTPTLTDEIRPYVEQYWRWLQTWQPEILMAEAPVYNLTYRYAGTCDGVMKLSGHPWIFDIKTTEYGPTSEKKRPPYPEVALQLVAYARCEEVGVLAEQRYDGGRRYYVYDPTSRHEPMPKVEAGLCIVVSPFDCFAVPVDISDEVWGLWLATYKLARWQSSGPNFGASLLASRD